MKCSRVRTWPVIHIMPAFRPCCCEAEHGGIQAGPGYTHGMSQESRRAAEVLRSARALLIGAGAGMGVDSGLPDFRGTEGFWRAYPAYAKLGLDFASMANPHWFEQDPAFAWGFYGHRLHLYRDTLPHPG